MGMGFGPRSRSGRLVLKLSAVTPQGYMRTVGARVLAALMLCACGAVSAAEQGRATVVRATPSEQRPGVSRGVVAKMLIRHVNAFRQQESRAAVSPNDRLTAAAQEFALFMAPRLEELSAASQEHARSRGSGYRLWPGAKP